MTYTIIERKKKQKNLKKNIQEKKKESIFTPHVEKSYNYAQFI